MACIRRTRRRSLMRAPRAFQLVRQDYHRGLTNDGDWTRWAGFAIYSRHREYVKISRCRYIDVRASYVSLHISLMHLCMRRSRVRVQKRASRRGALSSSSHSCSLVHLDTHILCACGLYIRTSGYCMKSHMCGYIYSEAALMLLAAWKITSWYGERSHREASSVADNWCYPLWTGATRMLYTWEAKRRETKSWIALKTHEDGIM